MPDLATIIGGLCAIAPMALLVVVMLQRLRASQPHESKAFSKPTSVIAHVCLGIAMSGGAIIGVFVGYWACLMLGLGKDDNILDLPWILVLFGSIVAGFFGPVLCYMRASTRSHR